MSETSFDERGNRITTNYEKKPRTEYEGTARGDSRKKGESRVEQNRRLREESRTIASSRPDSHASIEKETKRKKEAHAKIDENIEKVKCDNSYRIKNDELRGEFNWYLQEMEDIEEEDGVTTIALYYDWVKSLKLELFKILKEKMNVLSKLKKILNFKR